jgi:hypothetical protein
MGLTKFGGSLLAVNHLFKDSNLICISFFKLVNIILVSSANKIGLHFPLIVFDKSFT